MRSVFGAVLVCLVTTVVAYGVASHDEEKKPEARTLEELLLRERMPEPAEKDMAKDLSHSQMEEGPLTVRRGKVQVRPQEEPEEPQR